MPQRQGYCLERILRYGLGGRCKRWTIHHMVRVVFFGVGVIRGNARNNQPLLSITETEYLVTGHCMKETVWLRQYLVDVRSVQGLTYIMCNNQRCIALAKNSTHHSRTQHIDVQYQLIREKLETKRMFEVFSNKGYDSIHTNQITCKE